jgi:hypothetical protein
MRYRLLAPWIVVALGGALGAPLGCGSDPAPDAPPEAGAPPVFETDSGIEAGDAGTCLSTSKTAQTVPLDMVIALDTSFSMDFDDKWPHVRDALKSFVTNPAYAELGFALQFFPIRKQCSASDYGIPAVLLGLQPAVAAPITAALDAQQMSGGTPMVPLLQGVSTYLKANVKVDRRQVIVLATDGVPDDTCVAGSVDSPPNTIENAVAIADATFKATPSIQTFVIGVGTELTALDAIAAAGGTKTAILVDTGPSAEAAFLAALDTIRRDAIPCDFKIPDTVVDATKTNVTYTPATGAPATFGFVGDKDGCAKAPDSGWYFDDPAAPKKVILCAAACDVVKKDDKGHVDVVFGCPRVDVH